MNMFSLLFSPSSTAGKGIGPAFPAKNDGVFPRHFKKFDHGNRYRVGFPGESIVRNLSYFQVTMLFLVDRSDLLVEEQFPAKIPPVGFVRLMIAAKQAGYREILPVSMRLAGERSV